MNLDQLLLLLFREARLALLQQPQFLFVFSQHLFNITADTLKRTDTVTIQLTRVTNAQINNTGSFDLHAYVALLDNLLLLCSNKVSLSGSSHPTQQISFVVRIPSSGQKSYYNHQGWRFCVMITDCSFSFPPHLQTLNTKGFRAPSYTEMMQHNRKMNICYHS